MIHHAQVRRSLLLRCTVAEEPEVKQYDVVPFPLRILSPLSPARIFLCSWFHAEHQARNGMWVAECNSISNSLGSAGSFLHSGVSTFLY